MCFLGYDAGATEVRLCVGASMFSGKTLSGVPQSGEHCATETSRGLAGSGPNTRVPSGRSRNHVQQQTAGKHSVVWWKVTLTVKGKDRHQLSPLSAAKFFSHLLFPPKGRIHVRPKVTCHHKQHINWNSRAKYLYLYLVTMTSLVV